MSGTPSQSSLSESLRQPQQLSQSVLPDPNASLLLEVEQQKQEIQVLEKKLHDIESENQQLQLLIQTHEREQKQLLLSPAALIARVLISNNNQSSIPLEALAAKIGSFSASDFDLIDRLFEFVNDVTGANEFTREEIAEEIEEIKLHLFVAQGDNGSIQTALDYIRFRWFWSAGRNCGLEVSETEFHEIVTRVNDKNFAPDIAKWMQANLKLSGNEDFKMYMLKVNEKITGVSNLRVAEEIAMLVRKIRSLSVSVDLDTFQETLDFELQYYPGTLLKDFDTFLKTHLLNGIDTETRNRARSAILKLFFRRTPHFNWNYFHSLVAMQKACIASANIILSPSELQEAQAADREDKDEKSAEFSRRRELSDNEAEQDAKENDCGRVAYKFFAAKLTGEQGKLFLSNPYTFYEYFLLRQQCHQSISSKSSEVEFVEHLGFILRVLALYGHRDIIANFKEAYLATPELQKIPLIKIAALAYNFGETFEFNFVLLPRKKAAEIILEGIFGAEELAQEISQPSGPMRHELSMVPLVSSDDIESIESIESPKDDEQVDEEEQADEGQEGIYAYPEVDDQTEVTEEAIAEPIILGPGCFASFTCEVLLIWIDQYMRSTAQTRGSIVIDNIDTSKIFSAADVARFEQSLRAGKKNSAKILQDLRDTFGITLNNVNGCAKDNAHFLKAFWSRKHISLIDNNAIKTKLSFRALELAADVKASDQRRLFFHPVHGKASSYSDTLNKCISAVKQNLQLKEFEERRSKHPRFNALREIVVNITRLKKEDLLNGVIRQAKMNILCAKKDKHHEMLLRYYHAEVEPKNINLSFAEFEEICLESSGGALLTINCRDGVVYNVYGPTDFKKIFDSNLEILMHEANRGNALDTAVAALRNLVSREDISDDEIRRYIVLQEFGGIFAAPLYGKLESLFRRIIEYYDATEKMLATTPPFMLRNGFCFNTLSGLIAQFDNLMERFNYLEAKAGFTPDVIIGGHSFSKQDIVRWSDKVTTLKNKAELLLALKERDENFAKENESRKALNEKLRSSGLILQEVTNGSDDYLFGAVAKSCFDNHLLVMPSDAAITQTQCLKKILDDYIRSNQDALNSSFLAAEDAKALQYFDACYVWSFKSIIKILAKALNLSIVIITKDGLIVETGDEYDPKKVIYIAQIYQGCYGSCKAANDQTPLQKRALEVIINSKAKEAKEQIAAQQEQSEMKADESFGPLAARNVFLKCLALQEYSAKRYALIKEIKENAPIPRDKIRMWFELNAQISALQKQICCSLPENLAESSHAVSEVGQNSAVSISAGIIAAYSSHSAASSASAISVQSSSMPRFFQPLSGGDGRGDEVDVTENSETVGLLHSVNGDSSTGESKEAKPGGGSYPRLDS